jgi:hypothetical protein
MGTGSNFRWAEIVPVPIFRVGEPESQNGKEYFLTYLKGLEGMDLGKTGKGE